MMDALSEPQRLAQTGSCQRRILLRLSHRNGVGRDGSVLRLALLPVAGIAFYQLRWLGLGLPSVPFAY